VLLVSGASRFESDDRWEVVPSSGIGVDKQKIWVSPIAGWKPLEVTEYRRKNDLPDNMVYELLEMSGECLCGAFGSRHELKTIREWYPWVWAHIQSLEAKVLDSRRNGNLLKESYEKFCLWGHGKMDDRVLDVKTSDQKMICENCDKRKNIQYNLNSDEFVTLTELALQSSFAEDSDSETVYRDAFDLTQHFPEDDDRDAEIILRDAYHALDDVAEDQGFTNHKDMVSSKVDKQLQKEVILKVLAEVDTPLKSAKDIHELIYTLQKESENKDTNSRLPALFEFNTDNRTPIAPSINNHLKTLVEDTLIKPPADGGFTITDKGMEKLELTDPRSDNGEYLRQALGSA
jgi:hypothetical protein